MVFVLGADLGFQASQRVAAAGTEFGLKVLKDISQNLPTQAKCVCLLMMCVLYLDVQSHTGYCTRYKLIWL